jgi:hypothetical protein
MTIHLPSCAAAPAEVAPDLARILAEQAERDAAEGALHAKNKEVLFDGLRQASIAHVDADLQDLSGYYAMTAQSICERRRAGLRKLIRHRDLRDVVVDRLKTGWTPQQIAGRLRLEGSDLQVSHETIYQFAYSKDGHAIDL